jgi:biotin---protein ligase
MKLLTTLHLQIEQLAHLLAWKIDTKLSILIKTDVKHFAQLIFATFVHNHYVINDRLTLTRIQTVNVDGTPQDFSEILNHSKKDALLRISEEMTSDEWKRHLEAIRSLGVLANQASEFELKKNLTEGKTGIVQPDLISSKNIEESLKKLTSPDTPKKSFLSLEKTDVKIQALRKKSQTNIADLVSEEEMQAIKSPTSPKFPMGDKSPSHSIKSKVSHDSLSPKFPVSASPSKQSFFSSESKKSGNTVFAMSSFGKDKEISNNNLELEKVEVSVKDATEAFINKEKEVVPDKKEESVSIDNTDKKSEEKLDISEEEVLIVKIEETKAPFAVPEAPKIQNAIRYKPPKLPETKPPNVLVYSDSATTRDNVIKTLGCILNNNMYSVYPLNIKEIQSKIWIDNTVLLVVCGSINGSDISQIFLEYFLKGGKILCLCSDLLRQVLPTYHTAEVREHELVQFSYGKWKNIKMMHHIFCYQPSPIRKHFSQDSDEPPKDKSPTSNP